MKNYATNKKKCLRILQDFVYQCIYALAICTEVTDIFQQYQSRARTNYYNISEAKCHAEL